MKLVNSLVGGAAMLVLASTAVPAGDETPGTEGPGTLVRLEVVMTRSQGDSVVTRLPYTLLLNTGGSGARVYGGVQLPIVVRHEGSNTVMFKNAGGEVHARAWALEGGRFKVELSTELGGVYSTNDDAEEDDGNDTAEDVDEDGAPEPPVLRSFSTSATVTLRDGQSTILSDSADPITGETVRTEVTLHVVE